MIFIYSITKNVSVFIYAVYGCLRFTDIFIKQRYMNDLPPCFSQRLFIIVMNCTQHDHQET